MCLIIAKTCHYFLYDVSKLWPFFFVHTYKTLFRAFMILHCDYCCLLSGLDKCHLTPFKAIQNTATKIIVLIHFSNYAIPSYSSICHYPLYQTWTVFIYKALHSDPHSAYHLHAIKLWPCLPRFTTDASIYQPLIQFFERKIFSHITPYAWEELPVKICKAAMLSSLLNCLLKLTFVVMPIKHLECSEHCLLCWS